MADGTPNANSASSSPATVSTPAAASHPRRLSKRPGKRYTCMESPHECVLHEDRCGARQF